MAYGFECQIRLQSVPKNTRRRAHGEWAQASEEGLKRPVENRKCRCGLKADNGPIALAATLKTGSISSAGWKDLSFRPGVANAKMEELRTYASNDDELAGGYPFNWSKSKVKQQLFCNWVGIVQFICNCICRVVVFVATILELEHFGGGRLFLYINQDHFLRCLRLK